MPTNQSLLNTAQLRRDAKRRSRANNVPLAAALDELAQQHGFQNWSLLAKQANAGCGSSPRPASSPSLGAQQAALTFCATRPEVDLLKKIAVRFERTMGEGWTGTRLELLMDLEACHCNGCPLNLEGLAHAARDLDLVHDVAGIVNHLDRTTGKLTGLFAPRYADTR